MINHLMIQDKHHMNPEKVGLVMDLKNPKASQDQQPLSFWICISNAQFFSAKDEEHA